MLDAALALADMALAVFPCWESGERAKAPRTRRGFHDATTDPHVIERWWRMWPHALIGAPVPAHLVVLDLDPRHGGTLDTLQAVTGPLPTTLTTLSGGRDRGMHLWFRDPGVRLSQTRCPEGVDLRSPGRHYLIVPPSLHPATGRPYAWDLDIPAAPMPAAAVAALRTPQTSVRRVHTPAYRHYDGSAPNPAGLLRWVATAPAGERNRRLYRTARTFLDEGQPERAWTALADAASAAGLDDVETARTIRSARGAVPV